MLIDYHSFVNETRSDIKRWDTAINELDKKAITQMLENGFYVDTILSYSDEWDEVSQTGLYITSGLKNSLSIVKILIKYGANVNATCIEKNKLTSIIHKQSVLLHSINCNNYNVSNFLLQCGADVNYRDNKNMTALILTTSMLMLQDHMYNYDEIYNDCILLLEYGADISIRTNDGKCAIDNIPIKPEHNIWKNDKIQEIIITKQPWNIKFFDDRIGFLPELKMKYKDDFIISDLNI